MSDWYEPAEGVRERWKQWVSELPPALQPLGEAHPPWRMYRLGPDGNRCFVVAYDETAVGPRVRVAVTGEHNFLAFDRIVFDVDPSNLVDCDPPGPDERVGSVVDCAPWCVADRKTN